MRAVDALSSPVMRCLAIQLALLFLACSAVACSGKDAAASSEAYGYCRDKTPELVRAAGDPATPDTPLTEEPVAGSTCNAVVRTYPIESSTHVDLCSAVEYGTNPPTSGHHYPLWPEYGVYDRAIPRGFYVHSLEHGGVVLAYSCSDCGSEVEEATSLVEQLPVDPMCCPGGECGSNVNQMVLTPDPGLDTRWAAASWGATLTADCFEPDVFQQFAEEHRDHASELVCSNGGALDIRSLGPK